MENSSSSTCKKVSSLIDRIRNPEISQSDPDVLFPSTINTSSRFDRSSSSRQPYRESEYDDQDEICYYTHNDSNMLLQLKSSQPRQIEPSHISVARATDIDPQIRVELQDKELWETFAKNRTEMIVTKAGRRLFPSFRVKITGMESDVMYDVTMDMITVDDNKYRYQYGSWVVAGRAEPNVPPRHYVHPISPSSGEMWMKDIVSFHKVKLTNYCGNNKPDTLLIHSMHHYQPRIHVTRSGNFNYFSPQPSVMFSFPQTAFITVTAYQNSEITNLKVKHNPFAKGFRNNGGKTKNSEHSLEETHNCIEPYRSSGDVRVDCQNKQTMKRSREGHLFTHNATAVDINGHSLRHTQPVSNSISQLARLNSGHCSGQALNKSPCVDYQHQLPMLGSVANMNPDMTNNYPRIPQNQSKLTNGLPTSRSDYSLAVSSEEQSCSTSPFPGHQLQIHPPVIPASFRNNQVSSSHSEFLHCDSNLLQGPGKHFCSFNQRLPRSLPNSKPIQPDHGRMSNFPSLSSLGLNAINQRPSNIPGCLNSFNQPFDVTSFY